MLLITGEGLAETHRIPARLQSQQDFHHDITCSSPRRSKSPVIVRSSNTARCGSSISDDSVKATCSLESRHCTPDVAARDFADELDEHDMVGIHVVGENMRGRLAEKHRMLELALSRSSFRYALAPLPCTDLKHVITLAKRPVSWRRSAVSGTPSLPCIVLN